MTTTNLTSDEREKQLQPIRNRLDGQGRYVGSNAQAYEDLVTVLSLLDSQAVDDQSKPVGWISCGLRHGHDRIVDIVFENADCAKAFTDGIEPAVGPIVAATRMRDKCVEMVREMIDEWDQKARTAKPDVNHRVYVNYSDAAWEIVTALQPLTLDEVEQKQ